MGLGLLRISLAIAVLVTHSAYSTSVTIPGATAVKLFFIISGFYMALILNEKYNDHHLLFYKNRFLRLYPLYLATIILIVLSEATKSAFRGIPLADSSLILQAYRGNELSLTAALFLGFSNASMLFQDLLFFLAPQADGSLTLARPEQMASVPLYKYLLIPQAWSLSLEICFYLIAPFTVRNARTIGVMMGLSILSRVTCFVLGREDEQFLYRFFPSELVFFMAGSLSYHIYKRAKSAFLEQTEPYLLAACLLVIALYQLVPAGIETPVRVGLYFAIALLVPYSFNRSKSNRLDNEIGDWSYPFYILHMFTFKLVLAAATVAKLDPQGLLFLFTWIGVTLLLSHAMTRLLQAPFDLARARNVAALARPSAKDR